MKKDIMEKWVAALRSGEYTQGRTQLRTESIDGKTSGYCCLGVLCEISGLPYEGYHGILPSRVMEWAGMKTTEGQLPKAYKAKDDTYQSLLWELNDKTDNGRSTGKTLSFKQIANIIEKNWEHL